jgi:hypothetical protein
MRMGLMAAVLAFSVLPVTASETGEAIIAAAYDGALAQSRGAWILACDAGDTEACFGAGLAQLVETYETLAQAFYRHGAVVPGNTAAVMVFGLGTGSAEPVEPLNPEPEPLTYEGLRTILDDAVASLDTARGYFERAGESGDYVMMLDPLRMRLDLDGDGTIADDETFAPLVAEFVGPAELTEKERSKGFSPVSEIGFDRADAFWFAGYTQVVAAPLDWLLAHDFELFFDSYFHRFFPQGGLPMQDYARGGTLFLDADSDAGIADMIAAIHTLRFPVADSERLAAVLERLESIPALSRRNWEAIMAETDDNRELLPSPQQTSLVAGFPVTGETVDAWMATLDTVDAVLAGELLLPHWRFSQGFDLRSYFETATETDLVLIFTGQAAVSFLRDGPIADAESFAEGNRVFGDNWPNFALWFN